MDRLSSAAQQYQTCDPGAGEVDRMFDLDCGVERRHHRVVIGGRLCSEEGRYLEGL
jgi:hypothetical protein